MTLIQILWTNAFKKVNSTISAELSLSTSLLDDSSYSSSYSESQCSHTQDKQATHAYSSSVVIQVDVLGSKDQSNVQHVPGNSREATQLPDMAEDKCCHPQEDFAMDTNRPTGWQDLVSLKPHRFGLRCPASKKI